MSSTTATPPAPMTSASHLTVLSVLTRWSLSQTGPMLPVVMAVQALMSVGVIIGFGFIIPDIDEPTALHISTGTPTLMVLLVGLVIVPQAISTARTDGTLEYQRTLPIPRFLILVSELVVWSIIALPGLVISLLVAGWRYDLALSLNPLLLAISLLLISVMATAVGTAIAVTFQPVATQALTQVLIFFVMLFSPITFPASQLPGWFQTVHDYLPVLPSATLVRAGLAENAYTASWSDGIIVAVWTVAGVAISVMALNRRG